METDACLAAVCPPDTRCEPTRGPSYEQGTAREVMRPRCVSLTATAAPPLSRDPCGSWICPTGFHCTAPADAPYCERM